jgi:hypothetical protein
LSPIRSENGASSSRPKFSAIRFRPPPVAGFAGRTITLPESQANPRVSARGGLADKWLLEKPAGFDAQADNLEPEEGI